MNEEKLFETPEETRRRFEEAGQEKTFRFFWDLSGGEQKQLLEQAAHLDLDELARAWSEICKSGKKEGAGGLEPTSCIPHPGAGKESLEWRDAQGAGEEAIAAGRVAAFTVAGGQGTRLGFPGPKGEDGGAGFGLGTLDARGNWWPSHGADGTQGQNGGGGGGAGGGGLPGIDRRQPPARSAEVGCQP